MNTRTESIRSIMENCLCMEKTEQKEAAWHQLFSEGDTEEIEREILLFLTDLTERLRNKQALAEERQDLLNKWQQEKQKALETLDVYHQQMQQIRQEQEKTEQRMRGYETQFVRLQEAASEADASLKSVLLERDQAWEQFRDRDEKLARMTAELQEVQADRGQAWEQFSEREKQLDQLRKEMHEKEEQLAEMTAELKEVQADRDQAWEQFSEREKQLDQVRETLQQHRDLIENLKNQLSEAKQYGAEMAAKVGETEKLLSVRLYKKLHGQQTI